MLSSASVEVEPSKSQVKTEQSEENRATGSSLVGGASPGRSRIVHIVAALDVASAVPTSPPVFARRAGCQPGCRIGEQRPEPAATGAGRAGPLDLRVGSVPQGRRSVLVGPVGHPQGVRRRVRHERGRVFRGRPGLADSSEGADGGSGIHAVIRRQGDGRLRDGATVCEGHGITRVAAQRPPCATRWWTWRRRSPCCPRGSSPRRDPVRETVLPCEANSSTTSPGCVAAGVFTLNARRCCSRSRRPRRSPGKSAVGAGRIATIQVHHVLEPNSLRSWLPEVPAIFLVGACRIRRCLFVERST